MPFAGGSNAVGAPGEWPKALPRPTGCERVDSGPTLSGKPAADTTLGVLVHARRLMLVLLLSVLAAFVGAPAHAGRTLAAPQFTSASVMDSRTVTLTWTPIKGADHYVVEYAPAMSVYTSATSITITDLYPGDANRFTVRAETKRNVPSPTSAPLVVATPPEGPSNAFAEPYVDGIRIWWGSGIGCATYELATVDADGGYSAPVEPLAVLEPTRWWVAQEAGTTVTYAVRCLSAAGLPSAWSAPTTVAL